jgi:hypothetical protein
MMYWPLLKLIRLLLNYVPQNLVLHHLYHFSSIHPLAPLVSRDIHDVIGVLKKQIATKGSVVKVGAQFAEIDDSGNSQPSVPLLSFFCQLMISMNC